jgi:hypothetical protein
MYNWAIRPIADTTFCIISKYDRVAVVVRASTAKIDCGRDCAEAATDRPLNATPLCTDAVPPCASERALSIKPLATRQS